MEDKKGATNTDTERNITLVGKVTRSGIHKITVKAKGESKHFYILVQPEKPTIDEVIDSKTGEPLKKWQVVEGTRPRITVTVPETSRPGNVHAN